MTILRSQTVRLCRPQAINKLKKDIRLKKQRKLSSRRPPDSPQARRLIPVQSASIDLSSLASLIEEALHQENSLGLDESVDVTPENLVDNEEFENFKKLSEDYNLIPTFRRVFSDHLTAVLAYRCLVKHDDREAPSFLFESVVNGNQNGRYSFVGARPSLEVVANRTHVKVLDHIKGTKTATEEEDPIEVPIRIGKNWRPAPLEGMPDVFSGGWVGYAGYDTVRYVYPEKLSFKAAPKDDRSLPDMHFALYNDIMIFDTVGKVGYVVCWTHLDDFDSLEDAYLDGMGRLKSLCKMIIKANSPKLLHGFIDLKVAAHPTQRAISNMNREDFIKRVERIKEHIHEGDIFQLVYSQRFERRSFADPFEVYRALRIVNPSPYMVYLQTRSCIMVGSSPEILCRVDNNRIITNRPLAGTRPRGSTYEQDMQYQADLLADEKEKSEHIMLVDLGRNDVGKVCEAGSVKVDKLMAVERYSHVMHISSTVTGKLKPNLDSWDALRAALPAGTVSGAPKVRAMQIIDELEVNKRGPYGGGMGYVSFTGTVDIALALRTMVVRTHTNDTLYKYKGSHSRNQWVFYLQSGAGIVADSVPEKEYEETLNKAAALGRAIDLAEKAFLNSED